MGDLDFSKLGGEDLNAGAGMAGLDGSDDDEDDEGMPELTSS